MSAISHTIGGDIDLTSGEAIATVSGAEQGRQAILRRLCTNPGAYLWDLSYGAGLPAMIGMPETPDTIRGVIQQQMAQEAVVDQTQPITVDMTTSASGKTVCTIQYTDAGSQTVQILSYEAD